MKLPLLLRFDPHMVEVVQGATVALSLKLVGAAIQFALNVVVARLFGPDGAGVYFLAITIMTIATVFGRMGLDNTLLRFVAAHASTRDWTVVQGVYRKGMVIALVASVISTVAMVVVAPVLAQRVFAKPDLATPIRWMALAVWPVVLLTLHGEILRGLKRIFAYNMVAAVLLPAMALVLMGLLGPGRGPIGAIWAYTGAAYLTAAGGWWWWRHVTPERRGARGTFDTRTLLRSSTPLFWVASMSMAMNWIATFALGVWGTTSDVGIFNAATRAAFLVSFVLIAVNAISAPKFAELYKAGEIATLTATARASARLMTLLAAPLLLLFLVLPRTIMGLFGPAFRSGALVLAILALAQAANVVTGSVGYLLMMSGHERQVRNSNLISAVTCAALCIALVPSLGSLGAAIGVATSLIVRNIVETWMVRRHMGIGALFFASEARAAVPSR